MTSRLVPTLGVGTHVAMLGVADTLMTQSIEECVTAQSVVTRELPIAN